MYNSYYTGPYLEYIGIKTYIDSRAELFLKKMNKKDDIFEENYKLRTGHIKIQELIKKYNFTHLLFSKSDIYLMEDDINYNLEYIDNYTLVYNIKNIKIWVRNDIINGSYYEENK